MALNANLRVFACDLISHGAPRGWVTSAPGAERFFFPFRSSSLWNHVILQDFQLRFGSKVSTQAIAEKSFFQAWEAADKS